MRAHITAVSSLALLLAACGQTATTEPGAAETASVYGDETLSPEAAMIDRQQLLDDLRILSADDMQGRAAGTEGSARARAYIIDRMQAIGIQPVNGEWEHGFEYRTRVDAETVHQGTNILGMIEGTGSSERVMVISAHYDHEGVRDGRIYNGADDNASGVAAMFAAAEAFMQHPPAHDVIFAALDAEERGLQGARAFVAEPPIAQDSIAFNLNLDMVAMSDERNLWAVGTYHYPALMPVVERVAAMAPVNLPTGFDEPTEEPGGDWTYLTDSGAFHTVGIPFIYLGVDFHPHYHQPTDDYENMTLDFFQDASATIVLFARAAEADLDVIGESAGR